LWRLHKEKNCRVPRIRIGIWKDPIELRPRTKGLEGELDRNEGELQKNREGERLGRKQREREGIQREIDERES